MLKVACSGPGVSRTRNLNLTLARSLVKDPKSTHITTILQSIHWRKVNECIEYKFLSLTYKVLTTTQPGYLHNLIPLQHPCSTHSSVVILSCPLTISLKITYRSFRYASPRLWNQLPDSFCQPHQFCLDSPAHPLVNPSFLSSPLSSSITLSLQAQNLPFHDILPTLDFFTYWTAFMIMGLNPPITLIILFLVSHLIFCLFHVVD